MVVWHQKPCSGSYGAHAKVFESHDYCLRSVCYSSLIYLYLQVQMSLPFYEISNPKAIPSEYHYFVNNNIYM